MKIKDEMEIKELLLQCQEKSRIYVRQSTQIVDHARIDTMLLLYSPARLSLCHNRTLRERERAKWELVEEHALDRLCVYVGSAR